MTTANELKVAREELRIFQDFHRDIANAAYQRDMIDEALNRCRRRCTAFVRSVETRVFP